MPGSQIVGYSGDVSEQSENKTRATWERGWWRREKWEREPVSIFLTNQNQQFLQPGVLQPGVLTTRGSYNQGSYNQGS